MTAKRILVLGATGGTGRAVVSRALQTGHLVTALVRDPARLAIRSDQLRVIAGDATRDDAALQDAVRGQDAVISALGRGKSFKSQGVIEGSMRHVVRAMEMEHVQRLVFTSAFGVGVTFRDAPFVPRIFIRTLLRDVYRDKLAGEALLRASNLDWTLVYPTGLTDSPATGRYRDGERLPLRGFPTISRADVADFLVRQVDDRRYSKKGVLISSE